MSYIFRMSKFECLFGYFKLKLICPKAITLEIHWSFCKLHCYFVIIIVFQKFCVCLMVDLNDPLQLIRKICPGSAGSGFPLGMSDAT